MLILTKCDVLHYFLFYLVFLKSSGKNQYDSWVISTL